MNSQRFQEANQPSRNRILVIDDESENLENMVNYLEKCGYELMTAFSTEEAVIVFTENSPELILCELNKADIDGLTLIELFTGERPDIPVIVVSDKGQVSDVVEALRFGATDYLAKPITDFSYLRHVIESELLKRYIESESLQNNFFPQNDYEIANLELDANLQMLRENQQAMRQAQRQLLPEPNVSIDDYTFQHIIIPSLTNNGDFLDVFEIDDDNIGFYITDISGHTTTPALVTMTLKSFITHLQREYRSNKGDTILNPDKLLSYINQEMINANIGKFTTIFYAVIDKTNNILNFSLGGHYPKPVLLNGTEFLSFKEDSFPVGLFRWAEYKKKTIQLEAQFTLSMFSDGVFNAMDDTDGIDKQSMLKQLCSNHDNNVSKIVNKMQLTSKNSLDDDITLFLVQRR